MTQAARRTRGTGRACRPGRLAHAARFAGALRLAPHLVLVLALAAAAAAAATAAPAAPQQCPAAPKPLTHAPIAGLDASTLVLGSFDHGPAMLDASGGNLVKSQLTPVGGGLFGTGAVLFPAGTGVAIHRLPAFNASAGTVEMWVQPGETGGRRVLFSAEGRASLNGDGLLDLYVGEPLGPGGTTTNARIYFGSPTGLLNAPPATTPNWAPRGMGVGDVDGDGVYDLVMANNQADTLSNPLTPGVPGEVHIVLGPIGPGQHRVADIVVELDNAQGLVLADFDQDGDLDFLAASYGQSTPAVIGYANDGTGQFTPMALPYANLGGVGEALAAGDVNGDGVLDMLVSSFSINPSRVYLGVIGANGYTFQDIALTSSDRTNAVLGVSLGDIDGDGLLDAVLAQPLWDPGDGGVPGRVVIHRNQGDGSYAAAADGWIRTPRPFTVQADSDVNNDGHIDIVVSNWKDGGSATPASQVLLGPVGPLSGGLELQPPRLEFSVGSAVSATVADLDNDGIDDLFFRSSTSPFSPVYLLDADGAIKTGGGVPSYTLATAPSVGAPGGDGIGLIAAVGGGSSAYGSVHDRATSLELSVENGLLRFEVTDRANRAHVVTAPLPQPSHPDAIGGFHHVQAEWSARDGLVELRVGHAGVRANVHTSVGPAYAMGAPGVLFRLGSDPDNQFRAAGWRFDDVRVSSVRRSQQDADGDGIPDDWDNCKGTPNVAQADADDDGLGDTCTVCQTDLGFAGPGAVQLSVCGSPLGACQLADLELSGAPPSAPLYFVYGFSPAPVPFKGGTLVPSAVAGVVTLLTSPAGKLNATLKGGAGPFDLYVQAVVQDPGQPVGYALSNALRLSFLP
jgi:hypothetical protein